MLVQPRWLLSLLFIVSATVHALPPAGLKPRHLATSSLTSKINATSKETCTSKATSSPKATSTSKATLSSIATSTSKATLSSIVTATSKATSTSKTTSPSAATPTSTVIPSSTIATTASSAAPTSTSSADFYLVVAGNGTAYAGDYLSVGSDTNGDGSLVLYPASAPNQVASFSTFSLNADGTLENEFAGGIAAIFSGGTSGSLMFTSESSAEASGDTISICEIAGGYLTCVTGADTVFFICPSQVISGTLIGGDVNVGVTTQSGCTTITLEVVPV